MGLWNGKHAINGSMPPGQSKLHLMHRVVGKCGIFSWLHHCSTPRALQWVTTIVSVEQIIACRCCRKCHHHIVSVPPSMYCAHVHVHHAPSYTLNITTWYTSAYRTVPLPQTPSKLIAQPEPEALQQAVETCDQTTQIITSNKTVSSRSHKTPAVLMH